MKKALSTIALAAAVTLTAGAANADVNVYSYRQPFLIQPMFDAFTKETGIKVNVVFAKKGLEERLKQEGANSPADLVFTVDIGRLNKVVEEELVQPVNSDILNANVPESLRDPEGKWFALTTRARIVYASKDRVKPGEIASYEDLADPKWKGRICTRPGNHGYNLALISSMIAHHGEEKTEEWLKGVKANLARKPQGNDRAQVKAIWQGECDLAIGNTYYMGKMLADEEQYAWASSVNMVFPNQADRGTHVNISGVALTKHAPNKQEAIQLMEFLTENLAQKMYAEQNYEYPVKPGVEWSGLLQSWGAFKADSLNLAEVAKNRAAASKLVDKVGFNE
ncbi:Fe(3+) ABC transporter substrate-binding protein [Aestuariispira insulae]|uniref:Iron(III) transport system substrate-binding protein n=1 Tax=Aestuariispira insulae TaxID=1461337 RepID=A0A3D9HJM6_9PROT|nr:Fe(3+) ABC transporter substrate-binding protein [Aestuariispira insulae]RED49663.1 iron(III) transport system substrate-binding protein [Aestuariispira insulae]